MYLLGTVYQSDPILILILELLQFYVEIIFLYGISKTLRESGSVNTMRSRIRGKDADPDSDQQHC